MAWGDRGLREGLLLEGANHVDVESSRVTTAPAREEHISGAGEGARRQTQGLFRGTEGSRLSRGEDHIPDRVVARDAVAIAPTADLVVPEDVSSSMAFRAGVGAVVEGDTQPVPQRTPKFTVLEANAQGGGWNHVQPIPCMREAR